MRLRTNHLILLCVLLIASCKNRNEKTTPSGMKYITYREMNGKKPLAGDWVTIQMVYKQDNDSVLFDSRTLGKPLRFELPKSKFEGSFEEGLMLMNEGSRARFVIPNHLAYGLTGDQEKIPPASALYYDVHFIKAEPIPPAASKQ